MFPVGLCTKFGLSSPVVKNGKFSGFYDGWVAGRKFPVDMAGFAVSVKFLLKRPNATMPYRAGFEEDGFLKSLAPFEPKEIELLGNNCTRILAWHTQAKKNEPSAPLDMKVYRSTNLVVLKQQIVWWRTRMRRDCEKTWRVEAHRVVLFSSVEDYWCELQRTNVIQCLLRKQSHPYCFLPERISVQPFRRCYFFFSLG